jgi:hypothetical protein
VTGAVAARDPLRALVAVAAVVIGVVWAASALVTLDRARQSLGAVHAGTAETVARAVAADLERAAGLGIPVDGLVGVPEYLAEIVGATPRLRAVEVRGPDGAVRHRAAARFLPPASGPVSWIVRPVELDGRVVAAVAVDYVDVSNDVDMTRLAGVLALALLIGGWTALEFLVWLHGRGVGAPAAAVAEAARAAARGDLRRAPHPGRAGALAPLATAFGRMSRHVARRRQEVLWRSEDVQREAFDRAEQARVGGLADRAVAGLVVAADDPDLLDARTERPLHRLLHALAGAAATLFVLGAAGAGPAVAGTAAAVLLAGVVAAGRVLHPLLSLAGRRAPAALATLGAAAAVAWTSGHHAPDAVLAAAAALGAALGLQIHLGATVFGPPAGRAGIAWDADALAGAAAGVGVSAAAALVAGPDLAALQPWPTVLLLALSGAAAVGLAPLRPAAWAQTGWPESGEVGGALARRSAVAAALLCGLPAGALLTASALASASGAFDLRAMAAWAVAAAAGCGLARIGGGVGRAFLVFAAAAGAAAAAASGAGWADVPLAAAAGAAWTEAARLLQRAAADPGGAGLWRTLRLGALCRGAGLLLPAAASAGLGVPAAQVLWAAAALGAVAALAAALALRGLPPPRED